MHHLILSPSSREMRKQWLKRLDFSFNIFHKFHTTSNQQRSPLLLTLFPTMSQRGFSCIYIFYSNKNTSNSTNLNSSPSLPPLLPSASNHLSFSPSLHTLYKIVHFCSYSQYNFVVMQFLKKCCQCYCFSGAAYNVACCIDQWHSVEACGLAYLYCDGCYWSCCAPICIECKLGDKSKALDNCSKGCKYCVFSCLLSCVGCIDGCYNCIQVIKQACGEGIKGYADLTKNTQFVANKIKTALGLETGNEPLRSMGTFTP